MTELSDAIYAVLVELPKAEARCRRLLRKRDCKLVRVGKDYIAVSRTTGSAESSLLNIDAMEAWATEVCQ